MVTTEQIVREAAEVEARKLGLLDTAKNLASTPVGGFRYDDLGNPILENVIDPVTGLPVQDDQGNVIQRPVRAGLPEQQIAGLSPQQQRALQVGESGVGSFAPSITGRGSWNVRSSSKCLYRYRNCSNHGTASTFYEPLSTVYSR